ncbi:MAG: SLBB domain-containing protein [Candidatus Brocadiia bacterium]
MMTTAKKISLRALIALFLLGSTALLYGNGCTGEQPVRGEELPSVKPARTAGPGEGPPKDEENARLAWFEAERYLKPETEKTFDEAVRLYQNSEFQKAKEVFQKVIAAGREEITQESSDSETDGKPIPDSRVNRYHIAPGDVLEINVYASPDLNHEVTVRPDGCFAYYHIGEVAAAGKTISEVRTEISETLGDYIKKPKVTIFGKNLTGNSATVLGAVHSPGAFSVGKDTRLLQLLAKAGGTVSSIKGRTSADLKGAILSRKGHPIPVNFEHLIKRGDMRHNLHVHPGDFVYIPPVRGSSSNVVTVLGALRKPGNVEYREGMKLAEAVAEAGGLFLGTTDVANLDAADFSRALLARDDRYVPVDFYRLLVKGDMSQNIALKAGDVVTIPTTRENRVYVLGEVGFPREIPFGTDISFTQALASAGGMTLDGRRGAVYHVRGSLTNPKVKEVDALAILEGKSRDFYLKSDDIVYVSPTALTEIRHIMNQIIPGLSATQQTRSFRHGY